MTQQYAEELEKIRITMINGDVVRGKVNIVGYSRLSDKLESDDSVLPLKDAKINDESHRGDVMVMKCNIAYVE